MLRVRADLRTDLRGLPLPVRDAGVALGWFAFGLLLMWALPDVGVPWSGDGGGMTVPAVTVLALACLGAVLRRALAPAGLALGTLALAVGVVWQSRTDVGTLVVFTDLLYCAVRYPPRRTAQIVAVCSGIVVALLAGAALVFGGGRLAILSLFNLVLVVGVPTVWGLEVRRHADIAEVERARAREAARAAARERDAAVAEERARMARDLHDVVAGRLSAIALQSEAALHSGADPAMMRRVLGTVRESGVAALGEMRTMIGLLRTGGPHDPHTAPARLSELDRLLDEVRAAGLTVRHVDDRPPGTEVGAPVELAGFRIVQESLTNAAKHAPGAPVAVRLRTVGEELVIEVRNEPGSRPATEGPALHGGTGLAGLAERARAVGGTLVAGPDGDGWLVRAALPFGGGTR
ncbi:MULTISPECIES: sensor histidine kinase [Pseudonocardia]|uniref:histidine kinase n=2 Tax=Pseudonocardia TaxID=1847 RepID=A0A1Y2NA24_PSEAH|nr:MULTISPECIES: histidine kinase [Pseudonocardia]OSY44019.1 Sensor histidine kinase LiaS [Pseudonocardia autotrophica]TDN74249.1 signal transduction histidine kinase [Pseudonocardia autotrophica]BBG05012.1 two-component sensor histidine kinase [Pseudonocardia autotrophica]GEC28346.1 two-component sensor histidine kinase [Pseudonocardia saturnea]